METQAAVLWGQNEDWKIETIELDPPKAGEVLVKLAASGSCATATSTWSPGDLPCASADHRRARGRRAW